MASTFENAEHAKYGARRKDLFRIIQACHAWGNIHAIEAAYDNARQYADPKIMETLLKKAGIKLIKHERQLADELMYQGQVEIEGKTYPFYWRSKSMKSILQKLWQTAEYSNEDALRDTLGMTILIDDKTPMSRVSQILSACQKMMPNYGYIVKNRNMLPEEKFHTILKEQTRKHPMYTSSSSNANTNANLRNIAFSGFTQVGELPACGFEIQILTKSGFEWKKQEDPYYKVRGMIELLTRGEFFVTPVQLKSSLEKLLSITDINLISAALSVTEKDFQPI